MHIPIKQFANSMALSLDTIRSPYGLYYPYLVKKKRGNRDLWYINQTDYFRDQRWLHNFREFVVLLPSDIKVTITKLTGYGRQMIDSLNFNLDVAYHIFEVLLTLDEIQSDTEFQRLKREYPYWKDDKAFNIMERRKKRC